MASLESDLSDPSNPLLQKEREEAHVDPGELIKGLVDVKSRLEKFTVSREGRVRLVQEVLRDRGKQDVVIAEDEQSEEKEAKPAEDGNDKEGTKHLVNVDRRVGELEKLIGSASTSLDEVRCS